MKAAAYLAFALIILALVALQLASERARRRAQIEQRLGTLVPSAAAIAAPRRSLAIPVPDRIAPLLARAQVELTETALRNIAVAGVAIVVIVLLLAGPVVALGVAVAAPLAVHAWLAGRARKRVDALVEALPHYLDGVRQLQAVGNSLAQALERSLADAPEVVRQFFAPAARRLAMGAPIVETMQNLADRLQVPEVSMLAAAIRTNLRYGGSIAGVFNNLAHILRERIRIRRELDAQTTEAKVSSRVLVAMPLLAMALLMALNSEYLAFFTTDPRGHQMLLIAVGFEAVGILVVRRMLKLEF